MATKTHVEDYPAVADVDPSAVAQAIPVPLGVIPPAAAAWFAHQGWAMPYTPSSTPVGAGDVFIFGTMIAIATHPIDVGRTGGLQLEGTYDFLKKAGDTPAIGAAVYWDNTNKYATVTSTSNSAIGKCLPGASGAAPAAGDARVRVKIILMVP